MRRTRSRAPKLPSLPQGAFGGSEEAFAKVKGVTSTEVGYSGGRTQNPTYEQVCSHTTGHAEVVRLEFDPSIVSYSRLLELFFEVHDPTSLDRQGFDIGDNYRSAIFFTNPARKPSLGGQSPSSNGTEISPADRHPGGTRRTLLSRGGISPTIRCQTWWRLLPFSSDR